MIDIDHFKNINDTFGHQMGDFVLVAVTSAIKQGCRENDFPARWGGEEFIVLLHGADVEQSMMIAERIRENIANLKIIDSEITASIGVSTFLPETVKVTHQFIEHCISMADKALYAAKTSGRNRVVHSTKIGL
jgi:diguanylate cyclase (GGDEF)-like protein